MKYADVVEVKCLDVECPHWGWIKIPFRDLFFIGGKIAVIEALK